MKNLDVACARDIIISMLKAKFTTIETVRSYADWRLAQSEQFSDEDLIALSELSTAVDEAELRGALHARRRRRGTPPRSGRCGWGDAHIGLTMLQFESGQVTLEELLDYLGRFIDQRGHPRFDCEELFALLTRLEHGEPSDEIEAELYDLVSAQIDCVRRELKLLGFTVNGEFDPALLSNES